MDMDTVITADAVEYVRALPDECVDVVLTDSPYPNGMRYFEKDLEDAKYVLGLAAKKARKRVIFFWSPLRPAPAPPQGYYLRSRSIWHKPDAGTSIRYEDIYVWEKYIKGVTREWPDCNVYQFNVLDFRNRRDFHDHPTQKPVDLIRKLIFDFTDENDTILDPFGGTGTTGKAAKQARRHFLVLEKDEHWASIARERIEKTKAWPSWGRDDTTDEAETDAAPVPAAPTPAPITPTAPAKVGGARLAAGPVKGKK